MRIAAAYRMFAQSFGGAAARTRKVLKGRGARGQEGKSCALRTSSFNAASDMGVGLLRMFLFDMRMAAGFGDPCLCGRLPQRTWPAVAKALGSPPVQREGNVRLVPAAHRASCWQMRRQKASGPQSCRAGASKPLDSAVTSASPVTASASLLAKQSS